MNGSPRSSMITQQTLALHNSCQFSELSGATLNKVSVITVVLNDPEGLETTIRSVLQQNHNSKEFIVIDGGSQRETIAIIHHYAPQIDQWISEPDQGLYDAMNKGLYLAKGDWIQFLNAGDTYSNSDSLSTLMHHADLCSDAIYGDHIAKYPTWNKPMRSNSIADIPLRSFCCHQALLVNTSVARELRGFQEGLWPASDYDFVCRLYKRGSTFSYVPITFVDYECGGISDKNAAKSRWQEWKISRYHFGISSRSIVYFSIGLISACANLTLRWMGMSWISDSIRKMIHRIKSRRR